MKIIVRIAFAHMSQQCGAALNVGGDQPFDKMRVFYIQPGFAQA